MYPPFPIPTRDVDLSGKFDTKTLRVRAGQFIQDFSIEINSNNHKTFVTEDV